jgi:N-acetylglucosaminyl-diphospho-decaprenol L-rhamnosyltransferase
MTHAWDSAGVSVVVPHYGDPALALALVARLRAQRTERVVQLIVADDCSPQAFPATDDVEVVRLPVNRGFGSAVNAGAALATQPLLLILNSDVEPEPDFVDGFVAAAAHFLPAACSPALIEGEAWGPTAYHFPNASRQVVDALMPLARLRGSARLARFETTDNACRLGADQVVDWVAGACVLVPTESFRAIGGFDEGFFMYGEDTDLGRRLHDVGVPSVFVGSVSLRHGLGGSSDPQRIARWNASARFRYARKWGFHRRLGAGLAAASLANFGYNAARRASGKDVKPVERVRYEWSLLRYGLSGADPRERP